MKNYYDILNLQKNASDEQIRKQYRKLAMQYHPDHNPDNTNAEEQFKEIVEAYTILSDPKKRTEYDITQYPRRKSFAEKSTKKQEKAKKKPNQRPTTKKAKSMLKMLVTVVLTGFINPIQRLRRLRRTPLRTVHNSRKATFGKSKTASKKSTQTRKSGGFKSKRHSKQRKHYSVTILPVIYMAIRATIHRIDNLWRTSKTASKKIYNHSSKRFARLVSNTENSNTEKSLASSELQIGGLDIVYYTPISKKELQQGKTITIQTIDENDKDITFRIRVPEGSKNGQKLRVKGKGHRSSIDQAKCGDLYLHLEEEEYGG